MSASQSTINKANDFISLMNTLIGTIDDISQFIPEGKYLEIMTNLLLLYKKNPEESPTDIPGAVRGLLRENDVYIENARRTVFKAREYCTDMSDADKLKTGLYDKCVRCDKVITKTYMREHIHNNSCVRVKRTKKLSKDTNRLDTTRFSNFITSINAFKGRRINRKITMYLTAIDYFKSEGDEEYVKLLKAKLNIIAKEIEVD